MLEAVLKVLTEGERRVCEAFIPGWARCVAIGFCSCMGKTLDEVVRERECP
jgi:hypothetical protein